MEENRYAWNRFWCQREKTMYLTDQGYLANPEGQWGSLLNPTAMSFEAIASIPCLALLGEPGIGKTDAITADYRANDLRTQGAHTATLWCDLRAYGSETRLETALFEHQIVRAWLAGTHHLHLYLDSLDECLLRIDLVTDLLAEGLERLPRERLSLRVACRTADWRLSFERRLRALWGDAQVGVFELAPLRRQDVVTAAQAHGLKADRFLQAVAAAQAVPLAIKPITLRFLLNTYQSQGTLSGDRQEVYARGCELLCEETNEHRRETGRKGNLTTAERMEIADQLAAAMLFANRSAVWVGLDQGSVPSADLALRELADTNPSGKAYGQGMTESALRETLGTGLFSARGPQELGWAHQTYAEYLAAHFLARIQLPIPQLKSLLIHPEGSENFTDTQERLVPHLRPVATWLASMRSDVFQLLLRIDPELLVRAGAPPVAEEDRAALVQAFLASYAAGRGTGPDPLIRQRYALLAYSGLAEQMRPYVLDRSYPVSLRHVVIEIAEACQLRSFTAALTHLALDTTESYALRIAAAAAIATMGDAPAREALRPLALGAAGEDPEDELKGYALQALWPDQLSADELFAALTPPQEPFLYGGYAAFVQDPFEKHLQPPDVVVGLKWAEAHALDPEWAPLRGVVTKVLWMAWELLDEHPKLLEGFVRVAILRLHAHEEIVSDDVEEAPDDATDDATDANQHYNTRRHGQFFATLEAHETRRRQVLEAAMAFVVANDLDALTLVATRTPLATRQDLTWLIAWLQSASSASSASSEPASPLADMLARLIEFLADLSQPDDLDAILRACRDSTLLAKHFSWLLMPIVLDSPEADRLRTQYREEQASLRPPAEDTVEDRAGQSPQASSDIATVIDALLGRAVAGESVVWAHLSAALAVLPDGSRVHSDLAPEVITLPGWIAADALTRARLVEAAARYVEEQDPQAQGWLGNDMLQNWMGQRLRIHRGAFAGYRALTLVQRERPERLVALSPEIWRRWTPMLVTFPWHRGDAVQPHHDALIQLAYLHAPEEVIATFLDQVRQQNHELEYLQGIHRVEACWDARFATAVLSMIRQETLRPTILRDLLCLMLAHGSPETRAYIATLIERRSLSEGDHARAVIGVCALLTQADDAGWPIIWSSLQADEPFGRAVILALQRFPAAERSLDQRLSDEQIADLYSWVATLFPPSANPPLPNGVVTDEQLVVLWRDAFIPSLQRRRMPSAVAALRRLSLAHPDLIWLQWQLQEAEETLRQDTWRPLAPKALLALAAQPHRRLVNNGDQLLDVVQESLARLQEELQGETPGVTFLWQEWIRDGEKVFAPRDEQVLSDYIKLHLDRDLRQRGIIANREVEIRHGRGQPGERTDIHIDAMTQQANGGPYDTITAIIEVKGSWHREVFSAMQTQLADRYLHENQCHHGLYLVGWFTSPHWDRLDQRKRPTPKIPLEEACTRFDQRAAEISAQTQPRIHLRAWVLDVSLR